jgi:site-specific DNA-methyltransferase (adenine-specific)
MIDLRHGDCLEVLRTLPDNSVDSVVTDPPYGLSFMGKRWDYDVPSVEVWVECMRVLKPGGHLLAFAGTRTQHRMAVRIEDAGFEIRDMIAWVYGSGFPKSLDVSKAIDKAAGALQHEGKNFRADGGSGTASYRPTINPHAYTPPAPATPEAQQWAGWGTALKPALEPITVARKPLVGTVAANVLEHGTGAINVDGCRVAANDGENRSRPPRTPNAILGGGKGTNLTASEHNSLGRWPANLIHDGSDEPCALLGDAARFFYQAKCSKADRGEGNGHPTVKPTELMRYLCRLVTPPGGTVLDPFMGSGSTGKAAVLEGFQFIGIEREADYLEIARARIKAVQGIFYATNGS